MADDRGRGPPQRYDPRDPRDPREEQRYANEEEERRAAAYYNSQRQPPPPMASGAVSLPSIQDPHPGIGGRYWDQRDPRAQGYGPSPSPHNSYPPPQAHQPPPPGPPRPAAYSPAAGSAPYPPPPGQQYLPPVQNHTSDPRAPQHYPPQDPRGPPPPGYYQGQRPQSYNGGYNFQYQERGPPPPGHAAQYPHAGPPGAVIQPSAPRQRTSIACRYCRRRKIRCSGYQNSGGKCNNCVKMNQECVFQPVSSSSSTAFVPVTALQHGAIPPGTQLYGSYGQPLAAPAGPHSGPPPGGHYPGGPPQYEHSLPSPTGSYGSYTDDTIETDARRRARDPRDDGHQGPRLPPPSSFPEENTRRRSPSSSSPGHLPPNFSLSAPPNAYDSRTPPPRGSPPGLTRPPSTSSAGTNSMMSLRNIMDSGPAPPRNSSDIDSSMLGRLNRPNPNQDRGQDRNSNP